MNRQQQDRKEARTGNMRLASCGVKCLNSSSVFQLGFSAGLTVLYSVIPHERQAQKRYSQWQNNDRANNEQTNKIKTVKHKTNHFDK